MKWLDAIINMGLVLGVLEPGDIDLIESCFATQGKRKGLILTSAPDWRTQPERYAAWCAIMSTVCPNRMGIGGLMMMEGRGREVFIRINSWTNIKEVVTGLNVFGQRPFEFNMVAMRYEETPDPDQWAGCIERGINQYLAKRAYA